MGGFCIDNFTQSEGRWGGVGCLYIPRADVFSFFFSLLVRRFFGGYLVLYRDTGQGTAQGLDNAAGSPPGHALPRHIYIGSLVGTSPSELHRMNTSNDLQKKKKYTQPSYQPIPCVRPWGP